MELALYHPEFGYYARAARRSGRAGDFFTSVDVGPLFGELLETQLSEMFSMLASHGTSRFDLVEAGAGDGRLAADILTAACTHSPHVYKSLRLHLVEVSPAARAAQAATLGNHSGKLAWSGADLPPAFEGVLLANELLDAMPVHQVVMRADGLREVYVTTSAPDSNELILVEGRLSTPALTEYSTSLGIELQQGWRVEINLRAVAWIRAAARSLDRGFIILIDYGHEACDLYSASHSSGTLTTFRRHRGAGPELAGAPDWLQSPGEQDITSHVDFSSLRAAAEAAGLQTLGFLDQTYFLMGLLPPDMVSGRSMGHPPSVIGHLKTLIMPGGLGSTHKVMIFGKGVGAPPLRGCSYRMRVT